MPRHQIKRETDLQIIGSWIAAGQRVLDLGCGRGVLLEHLQQTRQVYGVGVDISSNKVLSCLKRGLNVIQGDAESALAIYPDAFFDWVILSRMIQEMATPGAVIRESLRVGHHLAVGFAHHGYWRNRVAQLWTGSRIQNEVFPEPWHSTQPYNPVTVAGFRAFCAAEGLVVRQAVYLRADWKTPCPAWAASWFAGYALFHVMRGPAAD
jgi:methionine biosynthesis protein MetW